MNSEQYQTVKEFIKDFRDSIGDTSCEVPEFQIISHLNKALRRLGREKGLDKLFRYHDSFELASLKSDGDKAASWVLNKDMGMIIDITSAVIINGADCKPSSVSPTFVPMEKFRMRYPVPESNTAGSPCEYTLYQIGGKTKIVFSNPIDRPYQLDMIYSAFHPKLSSSGDTIRIPYAYMDIVEEAVSIFYDMEAADMATARARYEDFDVLVTAARDLLAQQHTTAGPRRTAGSIN